MFGAAWDTVLRVYDDTALTAGSNGSEMPLEIQLKDRETGELSVAVSISGPGWTTETWNRTRDQPGLFVRGKLPVGLVKNPGAAIIQYTGPEATDPKDRAKQLSRVYVADVTLTYEGNTVVITANSWVNKLHGRRVFFQGHPLLPSETPDKLKEDRQNELKIIQGKDPAGITKVDKPREPADRIETYAPYNDLGTPTDARPILGGPKSTYSYPRRVATNRALDKDGKEAPPPSGSSWVPADNDFDTQKSGDFNASAAYAIVPLLIEQLTIFAKRPAPSVFGLLKTVVMAAVDFFLKRPLNLLNIVPSGNIGGFWTSFLDLASIYKTTPTPTPAFITKAKLQKVALANAKNDEYDEVRKAMDRLNPDERNRLLRRAGISVRQYEAPDVQVPLDQWERLRKFFNYHLEYPEPYSFAGRHALYNERDDPVSQASDGSDAEPRTKAWETDAEYGRQFLAGQNPLVIAALKKLPDGSIFSASEIQDMLDDGVSFERLLADANSGGRVRLLLVDYNDAYAKFAPEINKRHKNRFQYAGRCILYSRNDGHLVPIAIELHSPGSKPRTVYTPKNSPHEVWQLVKAVFASLDSGVHQLISHWLRTHANVEPYIIATDRNLSTLHPVFKLLQPHFQYTFRINADARGVLVNANKIIELTFTPGDQVMQLSAEVYKDWEFRYEALPADLIGRGLAKPGSNGGIDMLLGEYPYAEDGILIWTAMERYTRNYVKLYYKDDAAVTSDPELTAWWDEIKNEGHGDAKKTGWPALDGVESLTRILATMAWVPSAHHAAVNFGQADFSGLPLNRSSLIRKPIPAPGSQAWKDLTNPKRFEGEFLQYLSNTLPATIVVSVLEILSTHHRNEHYLTDSEQDYFTDPAALDVHKHFVQELNAAEETILKRNLDKNSKTRNRASGGLPYQLLLPSSPMPGVTGRGIPYSISI